MKSARYLDDEESVEFGEIRVFLGKDFVVTVRHGERGGLKEVRQELEGSPDMLRAGPWLFLELSWSTSSPDMVRWRTVSETI